MAIKATHTGYLPFLQTLSKQATKTSLFPQLNNSLISIGQLCDDGCKVNFSNKQITVSKNSIPIFHGNRSTNGDGLYNINLPSQITTINNTNTYHTSISKPSLNVIIRIATTAKDLVLYLHAACFSPPKSTFLKAVKNNNFIGWPGLTPDLVNKHLSNTIATTKGHIRQEQQGLQSTSKSLPHQHTKHYSDMNPLSDIPNIKTHDAIYSLTSKTDKAFMDLTGRFPHFALAGAMSIS